jgi:predicted nucleic acid-binding protein
MQFVVDANILFAALIKNSLTAELLLDEFVLFYTPEFVFEEFKKHEKEVLEKTKQSPEEFEFTYQTLRSHIKVVPKEEYEDKLIEAGNISPDPNDAPYFALALKLKIPIWSNDKKIRDQKEVKVYNTHDLMGLI